ncbi:MAG: thiamine phosphate synthase [Rhizobiaceae bacterium]
MTDTALPNRCRIVLIAPEGATADQFAEALRQALAGGDIASLILPQYGMDEAAFQRLAEAVTPLAQAAGAAVVIAGDSRVAGRVKSDGIHIEGKADLADAVERWQAKMMVGTGGAKTRDDALELGEERPDYIFFGRFGYDARPEAHHRNLSLGQWWAEVIEVPCIVMAGSDIASVEAVARTRAEFVALSSAVFGPDIDPKDAVARANALLDEVAPHLADAP